MTDRHIYLCICSASFGDALDIIAKGIPVGFGTSFSESLSIFSTTRHIGCLRSEESRFPISGEKDRRRIVPLQEEIVKSSSVEIIKMRLDARWWPLFPKVPILSAPICSVRNLFLPTVSHPNIMFVIIFVVYSSSYC